MVDAAYRISSTDIILYLRLLMAGTLLQTALENEKLECSDVVM
jgi:hypothetical protein